MRKLKKTLAMMSLLSPLSAHALGIGEIKLHSALNQNLKAEIPLIKSRTELVSEIRVSLASPEAFARAGVERQFYLSTLKFTPVINPDGSVVIKVSSSNAIREPFLDFLVEVDWPQGRIVREFTLLLDPPVTFKKNSVQPEPRWSVTKSQANNSKAQTSIKSAGSAPQRRYFQNRAPVNGLLPGDQYGPVKRNDTLWKIVNLVQSDNSFTKEQLLIAIFENNRHAFYKNNINRLKAGQSIAIPDRGTIAGFSRKAALAEYKRQNDVWSGRLKHSQPKKAGPENLAGTNDAPQAQLKLATPSDTKNLAAGQESEGALLGDGKSKADLAIEMATSATEENEELKSRLSHLEKQLEKMQRLMTLKDEALAAIQAQNAGEKLEPPENVFGIGDEAQEDQSRRVEAQAERGGAQTNLAPAKTEITGSPSEPIEKQIEPVKQATKNPVTPVTPVTAVPAKKPVPVKKPTIPETKDDFLTEILSEPFYLAIGGAGLLALGLLAFFGLRKRGGEYGSDRESILAVPDAANQQSTANLNQSDKENIDQIAESSFLSEFTPSDFDSLESETDEVDPISEADVYLAYGRYQQAEDLIRQAITDDPGRDECKLKLLEIFYAKENRDGFESYAAELHQEKMQDTEFWAKVSEMGQELCPENSLFNETEDAVDQSDFGVPELGGDNLDATQELQAVDLSEDISESSVDEVVQEKSEVIEEFDFSTETPPEPEQITPFEDVGEPPIESESQFESTLESSEDTTPFEDVGELPVESESLEFESTLESSEDTVTESDELKADFEKEIEPDFQEDLTVELSDDGLNDALEYGSVEDNGPVEDNLEFGENTTDTDASQEIALEFEDQVSEEEQVSDLATDSLENETVDFEAVKPTESDLEFDLNDVVSTSELPDETDSPDEILDSLTDMDEIETKLDLAKAYVDMDDSEAAKEILQEIIDKGTAAQNTEAEELIGKLQVKG